MKNDRSVRGLLRQKDGSVLIMSVCIMMFLVVLSLLLLKTSSDLIRFYERSVKRQQCEMLAVSVARVLQAEIEGMTCEAELFSDEEESARYDLMDCGFPADVGLEIEKTDEASKLRVTVICEWADVTKQVTYWYEVEGGEPENDGLEVE